MNKNSSRLVKAMKDWEGQLEMYTMPPSGMFGRVAMIESGGVSLSNENLDFEFEIPFDDDLEANEAQITVYNLSKNTIEALKWNNPITVTAGYKDDTGVIFSGRISKVTTRKEGVDKVTKIYAIDSSSLEDSGLVDISYKKGTKASYILQDLLKKVKLTVAVFEPRRDWTYKNEVSVDGSLIENIQKYAQVCGISVFVNKGKIYARHISQGDNINFEVSEETGLIESPEEFEEEVTAEDYKDIVKGWKFKMILQHRMTPGAIVTLRSINAWGQYRIRSGKHIFNENESVTECEVI